MNWSTGLALVPALICGGMMFGGAALAALGLRRTSTAQPGSPSPIETGTPQGHDRVPEEQAR